jgi:hypothetical protein
MLHEAESMHASTMRGDSLPLVHPPKSLIPDQFDSLPRNSF